MIIVAIDETAFDRASEIIDCLDSKKCMVKIGSVAFNSMGHKIIWLAAEKGFEIFLDLKFHDIPTTVYKACLSALSLNVWMLNVHLSGGVDMAKAAMRAKEHCETPTKLIGVTALTSLSDNDCLKIYGCSRHEELQRLKHIAMESGVDGFVCSPYDINTLKDSTKIYVTPGIRINNDKQDHHKAAKPKEAIDLGSDYIVIGRAITGNPNPNSVLEDIIRTL